MAQSSAEVVLVDYDCPDGAGDWAAANFPEARIAHAPAADNFCISHARNIGAQEGSGEWLVFVDADVRVNPGWTDWMQENIQPGYFYWVGRDENGHRAEDAYGTLICHRDDFSVIGGYDEVFEGWGGEDSDIRERFCANGLKEEFFPAHFISPIQHSDDQRAGWSKMSDRQQKLALVQCYKLAKAQAAQINNFKQSLPLQLRRQLWGASAEAIARWHKSGTSKPLRIRYELARGPGMPMYPPYSMRAQIVLEVYLKNTEQPVIQDLLHNR